MRPLQSEYGIPYSKIAADEPAGQGDPGQSAAFRSDPNRLTQDLVLQKLVTISENSCGACSNIQWPQPAIMAVLAPGTSADSARSTAGRLPLVSAPPMNRVGVSIDCASALRIGLSVLAGLSDQGEDVVAQLLLGRGGQAAPGAVALDRVEEQSLARPRYRRLLTFSADAAIRAARCDGVGPEAAGSSVASSSPPGSASTSLRSRSGRSCGDAERDVAAARMPHQVDRAVAEFLEEADHVGDVLRHQIIVADAVPMLGKKVPQADRDHAMVFRQRPQHRRPGAEVAERAVHADQRPALARFRDRPCRIR